MARLILSLDGQVLAEYNMTKERYTIGRLPDNDVRIDNAAVSGHHGLIINILNDSFLEDLNSTNGTYVNGKLIKKHALTHGDVITVGHHHLRFVDSQVESSEQDEFERTLVIQPGPGQRGAAQGSDRVGGPVRHRPPAPAAPASDALRGGERRAGPARQAAGAVRPVRRPRTGARQDTDDARSSRRAGRGDQPTRRRLLRRPCRERTPGDYPLVNGQPIGPQARRLQDNDVLTLAGVKMGFFEG